MEGLVSATAATTASTLQLILEHLRAVLLLLSEGLRHVPAFSASLWAILVGALVVVSLMVKRRHPARRVTVPGKRPAGDGVCAEGGENTGPVTEADGALEPPAGEASPLWLQTLCLKVLNKHLSGMLSLRDLVDLVKTERESQPPRRAHATGEKPVSAGGEQPRENMADELSENPRQPGGPEVLRGGIVGWEQDTQEQQGEKEGLEPSTAPLERVPQGGVRPSPSLAGTPLQTNPRPEVLRGHLSHVNSQVKRQKEAGNGDESVRGSEGDLKGVPRAADLDVSLQRADGENQGTARQLREQEHINEELAAEIASLRTEKASLRRENSNLRAEVQQLKLKLQVAPETHDDRVPQLQRQLLEAERRCSEMEESLARDWRNVTSTYQMLNSYKKMAQDMNQELRRSTSYYEKEIRYHWERAEEARMAAEHTERSLQELLGERDRSRQMLAKATYAFRPFPGGPFAPAVPPAAYRGPEVPGRPLGPRVPWMEQRHAVRAQGSRRSCQSDSAPTAAKR